MHSVNGLIYITLVVLRVSSAYNTSSETQGFNGEGDGNESGSEKKMRRGGGRGGEGKRERGSPGLLLYKKFFSTICFSELLLASFLI